MGIIGVIIAPLIAFESGRTRLPFARRVSRGNAIADLGVALAAGAEDTDSSATGLAALAAPRWTMGSRSEAPFVWTRRPSRNPLVAPLGCNRGTWTSMASVCDLRQK